MSTVFDGILIVYMAALVVMRLISARRVTGEGAYLVDDRTTA
jgi:hypothetical protein